MDSGDEAPEAVSPGGACPCSPGGGPEQVGWSVVGAPIWLLPELLKRWALAATCKGQLRLHGSSHPFRRPRFPNQLAAHRCVKCPGDWGRSQGLRLHSSASRIGWSTE